MKKLKDKINSKREIIVYIVLFFWIEMGIFSVVLDRSLSDLSVYFLSLTGFVMSNIQTSNITFNDIRTLLNANGGVIS